MTQLADFLRRRAWPPLAWGVNDCMIWTADWAIVRGYPDPAAPWRGRYSTELGARRIATRAGGMLALAQAGARRAGLARIDPADALPGDIALAAAPGIGWDQPAAMLRAGGFWAWPMAPRGLVLGEATPIACWAVR